MYLSVLICTSGCTYLNLYRKATSLYNEIDDDEPGGHLAFPIFSVTLQLASEIAYEFSFMMLTRCAEISVST
jgi:hypothetical protein